MIDTVLLTQDFPPDVGGTQTYSFEIARRLGQRGRVRVIAPRRTDRSGDDRSSEYELERVRSGPNGLFWSARAAVGRAVREGFGRAFCVQWTGALAALAGRRLDEKFEIHVAAHGRELLFNPLPVPLASLYARTRRFALCQADAVFPVSRYTADLVRDLGVADRRIHVVSNGADPHRFRPTDRHAARRRYAPSNHPVILTLCRLVPRKGVDVVLRALVQVLETWPEALLLIGGDGPERPGLQRLASQLGIEANVRFLGSVAHDELPGLFSAADVFVLVPRESPPDVEGFGLVFLEASACEVPVVASRCGGIPDAVLDGVTGLLVKPDDPDGTAAAIAHLLGNPAVARTLGEDGRLHVLEQGNWDRVTEMLLTGFGDR